MEYQKARHNVEVFFEMQQKQEGQERREQRAQNWQKILTGAAALKWDWLRRVFDAFLTPFLGSKSIVGVEEKIRDYVSRVGVIAPARFIMRLRITEQDSVSEITEIAHAKAHAL